MQKHFILLRLILITIFLGGCVTVSKSSSKTQRELILSKFCNQNNISWQWDALTQIVTLSANGRKASFLVGSNIVLIGEEPFFLTKPIRLHESLIIVPPDFQEKIIDRFKRSAMIQREMVKKGIKAILLDAGHGGNDPGAIGSQGTQEKDVVLDITKRLKTILEENGIKVIMTREEDSFISLEERTEMTSRSKADLFISIHANSSPVENVKGIEVFTLKELGTIEKKEAQRLENHRIMFRRLSMIQGDQDLKEIVSDMLYIYKQATSGVLASHVVNGVPNFVNTYNRGSKSARFFVLRNTLIPAILLEVGFLSNPEEEKLLTMPYYRQKLAMGIAKSILEYDGR